MRSIGSQRQRTVVVGGTEFIIFLSLVDGMTDDKQIVGAVCEYEGEGGCGGEEAAVLEVELIGAKILLHVY